MNDIHPNLIELVRTPGDINYFLPMLVQMVEERAIRSKSSFDIAELGVRCGNSTLAFLEGLHRAHNHGHLFSCDTDPCRHAVDLVDRTGYNDLWTFTREDSLTFAHRFAPDSFNLVFIDTSHEFEQTLNELRAWSPLLVKGGRMLLHDTCSRPTVACAISVFLKDNPWPHYNIDVCCGLGILEKP